LTPSPVGRRGGDGEGAAVAAIIRVADVERPVEVLPGLEIELAIRLEYEVVAARRHLLDPHQRELEPALGADRIGKHIADQERDLRCEVELSQVDVGRAERTDDGPIGDPRPFRLRRRERLGQHGKTGEQQRRIEQRLRQRLAVLARGRSGDGDGEVGENIGADHVEALHLAHDQEADQNERQQREISAHPPGRRLVQQQRRGRDPDRHRIEDMPAADREHEFRADRHHAGQDQPADAHEIGRGRRRQDQGENERGDIDRFRVRRHAQQQREQPVGGPAHRCDEQEREGERRRIGRHQLEEAQSERDRQEPGHVVEHQPVHGDAVEGVIHDIDHDPAHDVVRDGCHGITKALKPLVWVATPCASTI